MIESLNINRYRGFERFSMSALGRINLLVGTNNSGKTSVLEAILLLASRGDPSSLWQIVSRRGERLQEDLPLRQPEFELDVCHLFHNHELRPGVNFKISAGNAPAAKELIVAIGERKTDRPGDLFEADERAIVGPLLALHLHGTPAPLSLGLPLSRRGGLSHDSFEQPRRSRRGEDREPVQFVTTESMSSDALVRLWNNIALTNTEELVLKALKTIDPSIERIAAVAPSRFQTMGGRGGFIVKLRDSEQPIPIGSMGDGIWRLLSLAIALSQCKNGTLLVDEIDTGLHYRVLTDMWRLVAETAKELNVQVFATTHSYDCVHSLASVCREVPDSQSDVSVQRIERGKLKAIPFTEAEVKVAAEREIEVR